MSSPPPQQSSSARPTSPRSQELLLKQQLISETTLPYNSQIPTNDNEIKMLLRKLQHPICYFGENALERRQRLAKILLLMTEDGHDISALLGMRQENQISVLGADADAETHNLLEEDQEDLFFTYGEDSLVEWRHFLWNFSRERSNQRLEKERNQRRDFLMHLKPRTTDSNSNTRRHFILNEMRKRRALIDRVKHIQLHASQVAQKRPLSSIAFSAAGRELFHQDPMDIDEENGHTAVPPDNSSLILTGDYNGTLKLWSSGSFDNYSELKEYSQRGAHSSQSTTTATEQEQPSAAGHEERITGVAFAPQLSSPDSLASPNTSSSSLSTLAFASASVDKTAKLWALNQSSPIGTLEGHTDRLARLSFHPSGSLLGTASYDGTWRLWDLEKQKCLLEQDGHSRGVYDVQFHVDGSLAASCDLGGIVRLWDLRSGRSLFHMGAHVRKILSVSFANNGFQLASASDDNTVKVWDLRKRKFMYRIPAHSRLISRVRFDETSRFLITSSHDRSIKIWSNGEYKLVRQLEGHSGCISDFDLISQRDSESFRIATCGLDRTWKLYE